MLEVLAYKIGLKLKRSLLNVNAKSFNYFQN